MGPTKHGGQTVRRKKRERIEMAKKLGSIKGSTMTEHFGRSTIMIRPPNQLKQPTALSWRRFSSALPRGGCSRRYVA